MKSTDWGMMRSRRRKTRSSKCNLFLTVQNMIYKKHSKILSNLYVAKQDLDHGKQVLDVAKQDLELFQSN